MINKNKTRKNKMFPTQKEAINLLQKYAPDKESFVIVLNHSKAVQKFALKISKNVKGCNLKIIKIGSLLHDIGRFKYPPTNKKFSIKHGIAGAKILKKEKVDNIFAKICENHLGVGITKQDIISQKLPLPKKNFVPITIEEKIICYADNMKLDSEKAIEDRFAKEVDEKYRKKVKKFHQEIHSIISNR